MGPRGFTGRTGEQGATGPMGPRGFTGRTGEQGEQGATGPQGPRGFTGAQGPQGFTGAQGPQGFTGAQGPQGFTGATGGSGQAIYLATDQSIKSGGWLGLGTSGSSFVTSSIVTPKSGSITGIILNIRDKILRDGENVTATLYYSKCGYGTPSKTSVVAVINGPSNSVNGNCITAGTGSYTFTDYKLLSVLIETNAVDETLRSEALSDGVAVTLLTTINPA
jgi:hypothetical protein